MRFKKIILELLISILHCVGGDSLQDKGRLEDVEASGIDLMSFWGCTHGGSQASG